MTEYNNEMRGALFRIDPDKRVERGPEYSGTCQINGVKYQISAWLNTARTGRKYFAMRLQEDKRDREESRETLERAKRESQRSLSSDIIVDDEIPF